MVKAVDKTLRLLTSIAPTPERNGWKLVELARHTGLPISTLHRLLAMLTRHHFVERDEDGRYRLGLTVLQLGHAVWANISLRQIARPMMLDLARRTEDTIYLTLRDNDDGVHVERIDSPLYLRIAEPIGFRRPLFMGASRKAILAFLPPHEVQLILRTANAKLPGKPPVTKTSVLQDLQRIRKSGYAITHGETTEGTVGVAAPLFDSRKVPVAAISVSGPEQRFDQHRMPLLCQVVQEAARAVSQKLGYAPSSGEGPSIGAPARRRGGRGSSPRVDYDFTRPACRSE
jgi:DNA-binding IclR family transcriptional regulator